MRTPVDHAAPAPPADQSAWRFALLATLLLGLGIASSTGITGFDEYWHSFRTALALGEHGPWWLPTLDGVARVEKPPLLYWLMGLSFAAFGESFFAARLPSVLLAVALALAVRALARALLGEHGTLAGWLALGSFMLATEARRAMLDLPVALCTVLSVLVVVQAHQRVEPRRLYLAALLAALGTLFKGPVILIFLGAAAIAAVSLPELRRRMLPRRCWYGPLAIFCLLASIWPLLVYLYVPEAGSLLRADLAERQMAWPSLGSVLRVVGGLLVVALPWSLALLVGALRGARQGRWPTAAVERFLLLWILFATLPFLVIRPFERYFLPILPALLLWVVLLLRRIEPGKPAPALLVAVGLLAVPTLAFAGLAAWFERQWLVPAASVLALSTAVLLAWRGQLVPTVQATAVTLALSLGWVYPGLGINRIPDEVLAALRGAEARHYGSPYPGLLSMHLGHSVPIIPNEAGPEALPIRGGPVLLRTEDLGPLRTRAAAAGLEVRIAQRFRSFYARTQFLRFTRPGVRGADWRQALRARDWEPLKSEFVLAELLPAAEHSLSRRTVPP